jgi:phage baseplate assembly protein W
MPLDIPIGITQVIDEPDLPSKTYKLDLDNGRIIGKVDELEAMNQFIRKALITPRFKCLIYDSQYGSEIREITTTDATREFIESEIPRLVEDALTYDPRILKVYDFSFSFKDDSVFLKFSVDTIFGTTEFEGVI